MLHSSQQLLKIQFPFLNNAGGTMQKETRRTNALACFVSFISEVLNLWCNIGSAYPKLALANCLISSTGADIVSWGRKS